MAGYAVYRGIYVLALTETWLDTDTVTGILQASVAVALTYLTNLNWLLLRVS